MKGINTFLMFKDQAEEAVKYYASVFPRARVVDIVHSDGDVKNEAGSAIPAGKVHMAIFEIAGQEFYACDGGPEFDFSYGTSLWVNCENQREIDEISDAMIKAGGEQLDCGWVKDPFGMFWQVVPAKLRDMTMDDDRERGKRVFRALLKMKRINVAELERAAAGEKAHAGRH